MHGLTRSLAAPAALTALLMLSLGCERPAPAEATPAANPLTTVEGAEGTRAGTVLEVLPAGSYTYFRLDDHPQSWAVVMGVGPAVGQRVQAQVFARKAEFRSRRLDRTFATLHFVSLTGG